MQLSSHPTFVDGKLEAPPHRPAPVRADRRADGGVPGRPHARRAAARLARRELVAGRRLEGHLGARRDGAPAECSRATPRTCSGPGATWSAPRTPRACSTSPTTACSRAARPTTTTAWRELLEALHLAHPFYAAHPEISAKAGRAVPGRGPGAAELDHRRDRARARQRAHRARAPVDRAVGGDELLLPRAARARPRGRARRAAARALPRGAHAAARRSPARAPRRCRATTVALPAARPPGRARRDDLPHAARAHRAPREPRGAFHDCLLVLNSVSALEAYARAHGAEIDPARVIEFLLLAPDFPRSVLFCLRARRRPARAARGRRGDRAAAPLRRPDARRARVPGRATSCARSASTACSTARRRASGRPRGWSRSASSPAAPRRCDTSSGRRDGALRDPLPLAVPLPAAGLGFAQRAAREPVQRRAPDPAQLQAADRAASRGSSRTSTTSARASTCSAWRAPHRELEVMAEMRVAMHGTAARGAARRARLAARAALRRAHHEYLVPTRAHRLRRRRAPRGARGRRGLRRRRLRDRQRAGRARRRRPSSTSPARPTSAST